MHKFWNLRASHREALRFVNQDQVAHSISYAQLAEKAAAWRSRLEVANPRRNALVALEFATTVDCIAAYLGALQSGFPLLVAAPGQLGPGSDLVGIWRPELRLRSFDGPITLEQHPAPPTATDPHPDLALLLSTSGSTGDPKLVRLSALNIASNADAIAQYLEITPDMCAATTLPLYYSYGLSVLNSYLAAGASLALTPESINTAAFWDQSRALSVTSLALVPSQFAFLGNALSDTNALPTLRTVTQAGGKLSTAQQRRFHQMGQAQGWDLVVMYGQTEAAPRIAFVPTDELSQAYGCIGRAIPGGRLWLRDDNGQEVTAADTAGELVYDGPNVMMGYGRARPDLTRGGEVSELSTGDLAERNAAGHYRITGRLKRFVKLYGLRLSLDRIEAELESQGISAQAVAVDDQLVVLHQSPADHSTHVQALVAHAFDLPEPAICAAHLETLPLLASGKPDTRALYHLAQEALALDKSHATDERPSDLIRRLTHQPKAAANQSFLDLGGNSLIALEVQMVLEQRLGALPLNWESCPMRALDQLPKHAARPSETRQHLGADVILRVVAIALVVAQHASDYPLYGGTWMLIALMGYSAARFQLPLIQSGRALKLAQTMLYPILPLYFLVLLAYGTLRDTVPWTFVALLGNYQVFDEGKLLTVYWFISLYAQLVLLLVIMARSPTVKRWLAQGTDMAWILFAGLAALALILGGVLVSQDGYVYASKHIPNLADHPVYHVTGQSLSECLPLFALGWMLATGRTRLHKIITGVLTVATLVYMLGLQLPWPAAFWVGLTSALLAACVQVNLPKGLTFGIQRLATMTLFVYLLHQPVVTLFRYWLNLPDPVAVPSSLIGAFTLAWAAKALFARVENWAAKGGAIVVAKSAPKASKPSTPQGLR